MLIFNPILLLSGNIWDHLASANVVRYEAGHRRRHLQDYSHLEESAGKGGVSKDKDKDKGKEVSKSQLGRRPDTTQCQLTNFFGTCPGWLALKIYFVNICDSIML